MKWIQGKAYTEQKVSITEAFFSAVYTTIYPATYWLSRKN